MRTSISIMVLGVLWCQSAPAQKVYSTRFGIQGGAAFPVGEFIGSGRATTGFAFGGYVVMTNIRELSVIAAASYASIPVKVPAQPNIDTRVTNWKLVYLHLGLRGEHVVNERNDKLYGLAKAGIVFAKSPAVTYDYLTREAIGTGNVGFVADGEKANALAVGAAVGFLLTRDRIDRFDFRIQFLYAEPVFGFGSAARRVAIQQLQFQIGYLFD